MYCKHCYKMMADGLDICPACGKSQKEKVKKTISKPLRILLGIVAWFASMIAIAIIGTILGISESRGIISKIYSLSIVVVPVIVAFKVAVPEKLKSRAANVLQPTKVNKPVTTVVPTNTPVEQKVATDSKHVPSAVRQPRSSTKSTTHHVTGINYYMDSIMSLASENPDYDMSKKEIIEEDMIDERIWRYDFNDTNVKLVPEPENPHDPNAIMVLVSGKQVGYIKAGSCSRVLNLMASGKIRGIDCTIGGGPYKIVYEEYDEDRDRDVYTMVKDETNYSVKVTIYESVE